MSRATSPLSGRVAFLVGVRRSGTNWLRRIVDTHPDASVIPGETYLFSHGIAPLSERVQHGLAGSARTGTLFVDRDDYFDAVRDLCDCIFAGHLATLDNPGRVVAERTPDHVRVLDLIGDVYPDAAVVHIVRDGRDVARSLVSQQWGPATYEEAAAEWVTGIESARRAAPRLTRYLEVSYEALVSDPATHVPELYAFLGLDASPDVVHRALAEAEVPYNVDPKALEVTAAKWKGGLSDDALEAVLAEAAPLLTSLGYDVADGRDQTVSAVRSAPTRSVDRSGSPRRLARRLLGRPESPDRLSVHRTLIGRFDETMALLDELMADLTANRFGELHRHFADTANVRVVDGDGGWDARGVAAIERLAATWAADPALAGRQVRGDVHPGVPSFTVVGTWEGGGAIHDRVLVVTRYEDRIDELVWYVLPRLGASSTPSS